ncbi:MAG: hypothetical protein VYA54_00360 [Bdellovibrionota bacterium]|nr:hypothetical protein [Bdellovibrionota bacterium]
MKIIFVFTLLSLSLGAFAKTNEDGCLDCDKKLSGAKPVETSEYDAVNQAMIEEVKVLGNQICDTMMLYKNFGKPTYVAFEKMVLKFLQIDPEENSNYRQEVSSFWNQYNKHMICTTPHKGYETPQHLLKRVVDMNDMTSFYFDYFLEDKDIAVNAVEWRDGHPETVVDYLDTIIEDPRSEELYDLATVRQLRGFLVNTYGGKKATELLQQNT